LHAEVYIRKVERLAIPPGKVLRLQKALYGLKQLGREWYIEACNVLKRFDLEPTFSDPSVFVNSDRSLVVGPYVDDIIAAKSLEAALEFKKGSGAIHALKDLGEVHKCLGLTITGDRTKRTLSISQEDNIQKLIDEYLSPADYTCPTPISSRESLAKASPPKPRAVGGCVELHVRSRSGV